MLFSELLVEYFSSIVHCTVETETVLLSSVTISVHGRGTGLLTHGDLFSV